MAKKDEKTAKRRMAFSIRTTLLLALPCAVGLASLAEPILLLLFPNAVAKEAPALLAISAFTIIFTLINQTLSGALQGLGRVMIPAISLACGAIVKVIVNITLIPIIGVNGAAIGSIICGITALIINLYFLHKNIKLELNYNQAIIKPITISIIMGIIAFLTQKYIKVIFGRASIATMIAIIVAVIIYFGGIIVFKVFDREDYHMLPYGDKIYAFLQKLKLVK